MSEESGLSFPTDWLGACSEFMPRVRSDVCHLCLKPETVHPREGDERYWLQWLVFHALLDLDTGVAGMSNGA